MLSESWIQHVVVRRVKSARWSLWSFRSNVTTVTIVLTFLVGLGIEPSACIYIVPFDIYIVIIGLADTFQV